MGTRASGLTTFASTYVFAGSGSIGATLDIAFKDDLDSMNGVLSYDILPYTSFDQKDTLIRKLFFNPTSEDEFQYFMIDSEEVEQDNYNIDAITSDLANMIYADADDTSEDISEKQETIQNSFESHTFTDLTGGEVTYFKYVFDNEAKYLFFSDIKLMRERSDSSGIVAPVNKVGFTGAADSLDSELNEIIEELTFQFILSTIFFSIVVLIISMVIGILASRQLVDLIMNDIIKMCIKVQIAQTAQAKIARQQRLNKKVVTSNVMTDRNVEERKTNKNEMYNLFKIVEDILTIFKIKDFELRETNTMEYNNSVLHEYTDLIEIYRETYSKSLESKKLNTGQKQLLMVKHKDIERKLHNNIGCIWYALGEIVEAHKHFTLACQPETQLEFQMFDLIHNTLKAKNDAIKEKSERLLNYATMMVRHPRNNHYVTNFLHQDDEDKFKSTEIKIEQCQKTFSSPGLATEVEIFAIITSIRVKLNLNKLEDCQMNLKTLERIINYKKDTPDRKSTKSILIFYYY